MFQKSGMILEQRCSNELKNNLDSAIFVKQPPDIHAQMISSVHFTTR